MFLNPEPGADTTRYKVLHKDDVTVDSITKIDLQLDTAWSVEYWLFPEYARPLKTLFQFTNDSSHTVNLATDESTNLDLKFNAGSFYTWTTLSGNPRFQGAIHGIDWYHLIITHDGAQDIDIYVNGQASPIGLESGTQQDVAGPYDLVIRNFGKMGPFRVFQKELSQAEVTTLWNEGTPLLSTSISELKLEYTHENNYYDSGWVIKDDADNPVNGTTTADSANLKQHNAWLGRDGYSRILELDEYAILDFNFGIIYSAWQNNNDVHTGTFSAYNQRPYIWYDSGQNRTYIVVNEKPGYGGNQAPAVLYYDHATDRIPAIADRLEWPQIPGLGDTHVCAVLITKGSRLVTAHHKSDINQDDLVMNYSDVDPVSFVYADSTNDIATTINQRYPNLFAIDDTLYLVTRHDWDRNPLWKSTNNGASWSYAYDITDFGDGDGLYPEYLHQDNKISFVISRAKTGAGGDFYKTYFFQSDDGRTFYNVDSTYSQDVSGGNDIDSTEAENFLFQENAIGPPQRIPNLTFYHDSIYHVFVNTFSGGSLAGYQLWYSDGTTDWTSKAVTFPDIYAQHKMEYIGIIGVSDGVYDVFTIDPNHRLQRYRTTDFFDSFQWQETITDGSFNLRTIRLLENPEATNEITIVCQSNKSLVPGQNLFIYVYDKTAN